MVACQGRILIKRREASVFAGMIVAANREPAPVFGGADNREQPGGENRGDGNDYQQLNQCEPCCPFEFVLHANS
jgi:hypothetical protein